MARDIFHPIVREALEKDGWTITHDPYPLRVKGRSYEVDLGAEQLVGAEKGLTRIAVEVKSSLLPSFPYEFHAALGQYLNYQTLLKFKSLIEFYILQWQGASMRSILCWTKPHNLSLTNSV